MLGQILVWLLLIPVVVVYMLECLGTTTKAVTCGLRVIAMKRYSSAAMLAGKSFLERFMQVRRGQRGYGPMKISQIFSVTCLRRVVSLLKHTLFIWLCSWDTGMNYWDSTGRSNGDVFVGKHGSKGKKPMMFCAMR
jgi:hypothetical protein